MSVSGDEMWRTMVVLWIKWISTANKISSTQTGVTHWTLNWQEYRERDRQRDRQRERERDRERDRERERLIDIETARDTLVTEAGMHLFVSCFAINKSKQQVIWESTWHFPTVFGASLSDKKSLENIHIDCNYDALYHFVLILKFQKSQHAQVKCLHKILTQARSDSYSVSDAFWRSWSISLYPTRETSIRQSFRLPLNSSYKLSSSLSHVPSSLRLPLNLLLCSFLGHSLQSRASDTRDTQCALLVLYLLIFLTARIHILPYSGSRWQ